MSQNQEIIEAKLCAYIDGELDTDGRAEIEKHLEANPQHRRLLESLRATRDLLKWLPREPAPPEVAETLNGQLERSVLLDYDGTSMRPRIFGRLLAAAAIVVLTAGLAAAVYFALPRSQRLAVAAQGPAGRASEAAQQPSSAPGLVDENKDIAADSKANLSMARNAGAQSDVSLADRSRASEVPPVAVRRDQAGQQFMLQQAEQSPQQVAQSYDKELDHLAQQVAQNSTAIYAAANRPQPDAIPPAAVDNAVVMLVRSNDPQAAQKQLTDYLASNRIQWKAAEVEDLERAKRQANSRLASVPGRLELQAGQVAQTQPSSTEYEAERTESAAPQQSAPAQNAAKKAQASQESLNGASNSAGAQGLYVCRMSIRQAALLSTSISREGSQTAEMRNLLDGASANEALRFREVSSGLRRAAMQERLAAGTTQPVLRGAINSDEGSLKEQATAAPPGAVTEPRATTQPSEEYGRRAAASGSVSAPATQPAAPEPPATAPADEPVNVVIVVQPTDQAAGPPATQPAGSFPQTQPATEPTQ